jgi:hypothetical protein
MSAGFALSVVFTVALMVQIRGPATIGSITTDHSGGGQIDGLSVRWKGTPRLEIDVA